MDTITNYLNPISFSTANAINQKNEFVFVVLLRALSPSHAPEQAPTSTGSPHIQLDWAAIEEETFGDAIRNRFGLKPLDWLQIREAIKTTKIQNALPEVEDDLGHVTPMIFVGSLFKNREDYFAVIGLALDMGELTIADLPEVVLVDDLDPNTDGEYRITMVGVAVPEVPFHGERVWWDTSRLKMVVTSKIDPGSQAVECGVRKTTSGDYLLIDFTAIRRELPNLYAKLHRNGLFLRPDLKPYSKDTRTVLAHRLTLAAGGVNMTGLEGDHRVTSTGAWYGGPSTFDAHFESMQALSKDAHTAKTIERGEDHHYTRGEGTRGRSHGRDWARDAAEGMAILNEILGKRQTLW